MTQRDEENSKQRSLDDDDKEIKNNNESSRDCETYSFIRNAIFGDVEITINHKKLKNPVEVLQTLHELHHNPALSNADKNKKAREIIKNYME